MTRDDLRALRELANAAVDPHAPPPVMNEAYGTLLLKLIKEHEAAAAPWAQAHWTEYERAIAAAEREACAKVCEETTAAWTQHVYNQACMDCAAAIRARGA